MEERQAGGSHEQLVHDREDQGQQVGALPLGDEVGEAAARADCEGGREAEEEVAGSDWAIREYAAASGAVLDVQGGGPLGAALAGPADEVGAAVVRQRRLGRGLLQPRVLRHDARVSVISIRSVSQSVSVVCIGGRCIVVSRRRSV